MLQIPFVFNYFFSKRQNPLKIEVLRSVSEPKEWSAISSKHEKSFKLCQLLTSNLCEKPLQNFPFL